ncbi:MAG TPA: NAD(P) transhydrogenase subunit alpha [Planctomycetes bacterium]|jgi:NAD(P) transhydrogenase subunit alpha|nr:NAD(P) transhydrogenase subunit alpha [Planctomycetota bacterium]
MTSIFIAKESRAGEHRVASTPETISRYCKLGFSVVVEQGAGGGACFSDQQYQDAGATICNGFASGCAQADLLLKVAPCTADEAQHLNDKHLVVSFLQLDLHGNDAGAVFAKGAKIFAMEKVPRSTLAQKMDALSSQANIAGYKAVLIGACELGRYFPLLMTAAGTVKPARVVIFGVGVAGLQAIATAKRLGALVEATDIRPEVKEQVESLGAKFIDVEKDDDDDGEASVYASEASDEYKQRQAEAVAASVANADVVITTAQIPGRAAPLLIPLSMVKTMKAGAVIVDLAAEQGGNCEPTVADEIITVNGVTIVGTTNLPATVAVNASELYARNLQNVVEHIFEFPEDGAPTLNLDADDEIVSASIVSSVS